MIIKAKDEITTLVLQAAADGDLNYILNAPCEVIQTARCVSGCTALHWAAGSGQIEMMEYLVTQQLLDVNVVATKKAKGRTPLHYSCRNGYLEASQYLVKLGANVNAKAKHGVSPFQLAVWQNHLPICVWLVEHHDVDPAQVNDFDCGAVHWLGISPAARKVTDFSNESDNNNDEDEKKENDPPGSESSLLPLAKWLSQQKGVDFHAKQRQGHTPLHKAAWGGHIELLRYLRDVHGLMDDVQDDAGNYAADLADMANTPHHTNMAKFLREECSAEKLKSCHILGVNMDADKHEIRQAYLRKVRLVHPDRLMIQSKSNSTITTKSEHKMTTITSENEQEYVYDFDTLKRAYDHLILENGVGVQSNPSHSINLMLAINAHNPKPQPQSQPLDNSISDSFDISTTTAIHEKDANTHETEEQNLQQHATETDLFKARLIAVLLEYGDKGLALCNIKKKWKQVWPDIAFPSTTTTSAATTSDTIHDKNTTTQDNGNKRKKGSLAKFLQCQAGDVIEIRDCKDGKGPVVFPKHCKRKDVDQVCSDTCQ